MRAVRRLASRRSYVVQTASTVTRIAAPCALRALPVGVSVRLCAALAGRTTVTYASSSYCFC
jgi:hypothetical protein